MTCFLLVVAATTAMGSLATGGTTTIGSMTESGTAQGGVEVADVACDVDTDLCDEGMGANTTQGDVEVTDGACDVDTDLCDEGMGASTTQGGVEVSDGACDVDTDLCDEGTGASTTQGADDACDADLCDEGVAGDFACTLEQLTSSAALSSVWDQYCSIMTTGAKSFAMTLDCKDAGFDNVSGEMSQSYAGAMTRCITPNNATNCKMFDKMGAQCASSTAKHILKMNVQTDATTFSYDGRALASAKSALAELLGGINASQITTVMEVFHCGSDSECPADESTTMATGALKGDVVETTGAVGDVGNSDGRRLNARSNAGAPVRGTYGGPRRRSQYVFHSAVAQPAISVQQPRGIPRSLGSGRALTTDGGDDMDDYDGASEGASCAADIEFDLCDGVLPAGTYTPSESYGCVCGMEGQCPFEVEDDLCDGQSHGTTTTGWEVAGTTKGDGQVGSPARQLSERPRHRVKWRAREAEAASQFDMGRRLGSRGVGGAVVIVTSTISASPADINFFTEKHDAMGSSAVWFLDNQLQMHLSRHGVGVQSLVSLRRLMSGPQHGVVQATSSEIVGEESVQPAAYHGPEVALGEESVEASSIAIIIVVVVVIVLWVLVAAAGYCIWARRKRRRGLAEAWEPPEADTTLFKMPDPRQGAFGLDVPIVAFGSGHSVSEACSSFVLEGVFDMTSLGGIRVKAPADPDAKKFLSSEAAFLALPFWSRADAFQELKVQEARDKVANELRGTEDEFHRLGGFANHWAGMKTILEVKFKEEKLAKALLSTRDSFLLLHSSAADGDWTWSDNSDGEGENKLGMLLMIIRDEIAPPRVQTWRDFIKELYDMDAGVPLGVEESRTWQHIVRSARAAVVNEPLVAPPSAVDVPPEETLQVNIKVLGISCSGLEAHRPSKKEFDALVQQTLAEHAGNNLQPNDVTVKLYAGSVIADAVISCPPGVSCSKLKSDLCASGNLPAVLTHRIAGMAHLGMIREGCIHVDVEVDGVPLILVDPAPAKPRGKERFLDPLPAAPAKTSQNSRGLGDGTDRSKAVLALDMVPPVPSKEHTFLSQQAPVPGGMSPNGKKQRNKIPSPAPVKRGHGEGGGNVKSAAALADVPKVSAREGSWPSRPGELLPGSVDPRETKPKNKIPLTFEGEGTVKVRISGQV